MCIRDRPILNPYLKTTTVNTTMTIEKTKKAHRYPMIVLNRSINLDNCAKADIAADYI